MNPPCVSFLCLTRSLKKGPQPVTKHTSRPGGTEDFVQKLGTQIGLANSFLPSHPFFFSPGPSKTQLISGCMLQAVKVSDPANCRPDALYRLSCLLGGNNHDGRDKLKPQKQRREWTYMQLGARATPTLGISCPRVN